MRITQKLGVLVAVPLCAVSGFGALALVASASGAVQAGHLWDLMNSADAAGALVARLQDERTSVTAYLTAAPGTMSVASLDGQTAKTDAAIAAWRERASRLHHVPQDTKDLLQRIDDGLSQLPGLRQQIRAGDAPALSSVVFQYRIAIADLLSFQGGVAQAGQAPPDIAGTIRAASALAQASESTSQEEVDVLRLAIGIPLTPNTQQDITVARTGYTNSLETFTGIAAPTWRARPAQALAGANVAEAARLEDQVARTPVGKPVRIEPATWITAMSAREDALDEVHGQLNQEILTAIAAERHRQRNLAEIEAASVAGTVLIALMVSLRLGRPMIRGLRQLRDTAHSVAYEGLPAAVEALHSGGALSEKTPEEFADQIGPAVRVSGNDEIAAVGRAFNAVHREAIRTAADMEMLRAGVGAAFVALARRGQRLTGALTTELDRAERDEQDPDRLARLFVLDHLAARMSRNNESLLVLGGEGTARVGDRGVSLLDVVRGAMGRIERYSRVDTAAIDSSVTIVPGAVDHLVHLVAELMDNATAFSSPDSRVAVDASMLADRIILQVADRGIGLTPRQRDELNARLAAPRAADITAVRAMGLTVAARLASWYGIDVELRPRPGGGTIAEVTLPSAVYTIGDSPYGSPSNMNLAGANPAVPQHAYPTPAIPATPAVRLPQPPGVGELAPAVYADLDLRPGPGGYNEAPYPAADAGGHTWPRHAAVTDAGPRMPQRAAAAEYSWDQPRADNGDHGWPQTQYPETHYAETHYPETYYPETQYPATSEPMPAAWPQPQPAAPFATTLHGLPKRVPLAQLPSEAVKERDTPDAEDQRDPTQVSNTMAAYARVIGSEPGPNPHNYPPTTSTGNF